MNVLKAMISTLATMMLAGCASHAWEPGPNARTNVTFEQQKASCSLMARQGGTGFAAAGRADFVAAAAVGHAIGDGVRANTDFNDCMLASGWVTVDEKVAEAQHCRTPMDMRLNLPACNFQ